MAHSSGTVICLLRSFAFTCCLLLLAGCSRQAAPSFVFHERDNPEQLSAWGILQHRDGALALSAGVEPYFLASELFSDYAQKLRTIALPEGGFARIRPDGSIQFPVGTVISKTFYYPLAAASADSDGRPQVVKRERPDWVPGQRALALDRVRLVETRLLVKRSNGWHALPYLWSEQQQDAVLERTGAVVPMVLSAGDTREAFNYIVPNVNQCAGCHVLDHASKMLMPIGLHYRHVQSEQHIFAGRQLAVWQANGLLSPTAPLALASVRLSVDWRDARLDLRARARAYLDVNCGHCHSATGPADTSGLLLDATHAEPVQLGVCKPPIAAGQGTGGRLFSIVPGRPEESILLYRMMSQDIGAMMPELGRSLVHVESVALVAEWIEQMQGGCAKASF